MSPRPPFTSKLGKVRNAGLAMLLRPFRWFSPALQLVIGFSSLVVLTTLLLATWPLTLNSIGLLVLVFASYLIVWRFVDYRAGIFDLSISKRRAFALVGSAIVVETALMRLGFMVAAGFSAQSTHPSLNDPAVWSYAIPFAAASLLITMLVDKQLALIAGAIAAVFAGLLAPAGVLTALYAFISCAAAVYGIKRYRERQSITLAGLVVAAVNGVTALALITLTQRHPTITSALVAAGCGIGSGLFTIIFAAGGVPINESLFGVLTDIRLLELSNADLPVLSQLALRAPGTNQHSHAVGQLAEDACRAIGANALLARIGSLYHDIGKVAAPDYFVENQIGHNPHDRLRPTQSARIITSHVTYGLKLAKEIGLPKPVADFIPQHHGTRTLHFFLRKAEDEAGNGERVDEADFRYPGPKPQFKESAIMMLADSCEAAARSLAHPDPESIRSIVARIFDAIVSDGQLDECDLTLRELTEIREAIVTSLVAIYHSRIDYPGFNVPPPTDTGTSPTPGSPAGQPGWGGAVRESSIEPRGVRYEKPSDVPINPAGEVEDEAVPHRRNS
jgi:putative nucleotidyltransferase with HDIG domain